MNYLGEFGNNREITINILRKTGSIAINAEQAENVSETLNHALRYTSKNIILEPE